MAAVDGVSGLCNDNAETARGQEYRTWVSSCSALTIALVFANGFEFPLPAELERR
jgi:hypothetical protein